MIKTLPVIAFGKFVIASCLWVGAGLAFGHQDPRGDIHPKVSVIDGKFAIDFNTSMPDQDGNYSEEKPILRMIYNPDGILFAPRHPIERKRSYAELGPVGIYGKNISLGESTLVFEGNRSTRPGYILKSPDGKLSKVDLPWPERTNLMLFEDAMATPSGIAITGKESNGENEENGPLRFYWFSYGEKGSPVILDIGPTACIYYFPVASNLAFAGGRFWVGLIHPVDENLKAALWSWKPGDKEGRMDNLDSPADWNSHMSLAAIGDQLCLAYHCVVRAENQPTDDAKIITVFRKAE